MLTTGEEMKNSNFFTLIPTHPFTSRVVILCEQDLERASRHLSVTPTIPNKLHEQLLSTICRQINNTQQLITLTWESVYI